LLLPPFSSLDRMIPSSSPLSPVSFKVPRSRCAS
jgi:hypothetical protein